MSTLLVNVLGTPRPKGSMRVVSRDRFGQPLPRARLIANSPHKLQSWDRNVAGAAIAAMVQVGRDEFPWHKRPLAVVATFRFARPEGHFGARGLRPKAPLFMTSKPDVDKILRATLDAMTGLVYDDDSRIVAESSRKAWCADHEAPGALLELTTLDDVQLLIADAIRPAPAQPEISGPRYVVDPSHAAEDAELFSGPLGPTEEEIEQWHREGSAEIHRVFRKEPR
jgi:Holliday junction resolvase RusA-like endonuclease